jgi:peptidoglycan hydrolase-like protein with peptidoglycan-binding domain
MRRPVVIAVSLLALAGCTGGSAESRAREAEKKIKESIPDIEGKALAQKVTSEQVTQAQEALKVASEYLGEIDGKLDAVTVNSIEAFQRSHGLEANGILNEKTERLLREAAAKK